MNPIVLHTALSMNTAQNPAVSLKVPSGKYKQEGQIVYIDDNSVCKTGGRMSLSQINSFRKNHQNELAGCCFSHL